MKNLTGTPYHIENQRYMYTQEHGSETSKAPDQKQINRAAKLGNRVQVQNIIDSVKNNCKQMSIGKKYYIGGKDFRNCRAETSDKSILKVNQNEGYIQAVKSGEVILTIRSPSIKKSVDILIKVLTWKEYFEWEEKESEKRMAEFLTKLKSR